MYDFLIIGAGVIGTSIARELSKYNVNTCILEKTDDVSNGASKANSGIVHGGYAAKFGSLKGNLCFLGNQMFKSLNEELNFGYRKTGGLVLAFNANELKELNNLFENGKKFGLKNLKILEKKEILKIEPNINKEVMFALYCPDVGVTSPYEYTIALAENAIENGTELFLNSEVLAIKEYKDHFEVITKNKTFKTKYLINAAGVYADKISSMLGINTFKIIPRKGEYILFEKGTGSIVNNVIFQVPTKKGKGILVTSTYHGNLMIGPNAEEVENKENTKTSEEMLTYIIETAKKSVPFFDMKKKLKTFSGIRPTPNTGDFIIEESKERFINVAGIESPGLTSSPAIAKYVLEILKKSIHLEKKKNFNPYRKPIIKQKTLTPKELKNLINIKSSNEKIICRCEQVTEGEILDTLNRNIPIKTVKAIKMRTRAGMGRCQGAFCKPRVEEVIKKFIEKK
ncbi:FAD/NAD(P)-binding oxidoreductase [Tepiditoga spiralis]|uniref:FAD/NAD(P)-binding oxidoreductase n=1 Tax=Tepiditoga spiralis TaxID=2108365 RepID=A0A7G1G5Z4_9BACT|nr:NAD(P)/FAD-dependent oxidoreductase [Tepiditoga spiralis]BBE30756.1 FAD/NAD(P)-binding oxidoreductase [Tepiditoga spiralis]